MRLKCVFLKDQSVLYPAPASMSECSTNTQHEELYIRTEGSFADKTDWKDENELLTFLHCIRTILVSGNPPLTGWTWYKFHKRVYRHLRAISGKPLRPEREYSQFWSALRKHYISCMGTKDTLKASGLCHETLSQLEEIKQYISTNDQAFDIFSEPVTKIWNCPKWIFPSLVHSKFDSNIEPSPTQSSSDAPLKSLEDSFLNAPLIIGNSQLPIHVENLWNKSGLQFCSDGGANRIFDWNNALQSESKFIPKFIVGDMDSIRPEVLAFYESQGTHIARFSGQDNTDLDKTLDFFSGMTQYHHHKLIMLTGITGGNISQELANYHSCWKHQQLQIVFVSDSGLILHLAPGKHIIRATIGLKCGIMPIGEPCKSITTTGLKWNLDDDILQFGVLVSSSNVTISDSITIETSHNVLWTFDCAG